jgi:uncharacterized protein YndB with AHSA1/START domain
MKLTTTQSFSQPPAHVFEALTDFEHFETLARARGAQVTRRDPAGQIARGSVWTSVFDWRGRERRLTTTLAGWAPGQSLRFDLASRPVDGELEIHLTPTESGGTEVETTLTLTPKTLPAKLAVQSLKLTRGRAQRRISNAINTLVMEA